MKITKYGVIMAVKNVGVFLASWGITGIRTRPDEFLLAVITYGLISVPSDLYLLNHLDEKCKEEASKAALMGNP
jgi:hypothetical protein